MSVLAEIVTRVTERLARTRRRFPAGVVREAAESAAPGASFAGALAGPGMSLIAEAKRRSPSRGLLRDPYDPVALARAYQAAGARAVSVLTEPDFFGGAPEHLRAVRDAVSLPLLRKDFVVDEYQLLEARAWGASAALLIVAVLDDGRLADLRATCADLGLDALVEVHTEAEAERALRAGARFIGVNNRDLVTFATDRATTGRVARLLPPGLPLVAESGISARAHMLEVHAAGASAALVGEALVTALDPGAKAQELLGTRKESGA